MVAGKSKAFKDPSVYAGLEVACDLALNSILMRTKAPAAPTTKDFTNMFLSSVRLAAITAQSIKIATKSLSLWDLGIQR